MADSAPIRWTPETGWICTPPSVLPADGVLKLMAFALKVYDQRLRGVGHGPRRDMMVKAVDELRGMLARREPVKCIITSRGDTPLFKADKGYTPARLISIGG